jgi:hypothetical protein
MKITKETLTILLNIVFTIVVWAVSAFVSPTAANVLKSIWAIAQPVVLWILVRWLRIEVSVLRDEIVMLHAQLRLK